MASWFERKIARPIKDWAKGDRAVEQDKQRREGQQALKDAGYNVGTLAGAVKNTPNQELSNLINWKEQQWNVFNAYRAHYGQGILTYPDWHEKYWAVGNPLGDYTDSDVIIIPAEVEPETDLRRIYDKIDKKVSMTPIADYINQFSAVVTDSETGERTIVGISVSDNKILLFAGSGIILWMVFK